MSSSKKRCIYLLIYNNQGAPRCIPTETKGEAPGLQRGGENLKFGFIMARIFENLRNDKVNGTQFAYLLDSINHEGNDREKVGYFYNCFINEFDFEYNRRRWPNTAERIGEYLQGLPSCCSVAFTYWDIEQQGKKWGYCNNEKETAKFIENWFRVLGFRLVTLIDAAGI